MNDITNILEKEWEKGSYRPECKVNIGITLTSQSPFKANERSTIDVYQQRTLLSLEALTSINRMSFKNFKTGDPSTNENELGLPKYERFFRLKEDSGTIKYKNIIKSIQASSAFPVAFAPVELEGVLIPKRKECAKNIFVDGGVFDNIPIELLEAISKNNNPNPLAEVHFIDPDNIRGKNAGKNKPNNDIYNNLLTGDKQLTTFINQYIDTSRNAELAKFLKQDTETVKILKPTNRYFPLYGSNLINFGAFLSKSFRRHDYLIGVYDGIFKWCKDEGNELSKSIEDWSNFSTCVSEKINGITTTPLCTEDKLFLAYLYEEEARIVRSGNYKKFYRSLNCQKQTTIYQKLAFELKQSQVQQLNFISLIENVSPMIINEAKKHPYKDRKINTKNNLKGLNNQIAQDEEIAFLKSPSKQAHLIVHRLLNRLSNIKKFKENKDNLDISLATIYALSSHTNKRDCCLYVSPSIPYQIGLPNKLVFFASNLIHSIEMGVEFSNKHPSIKMQSLSIGASLTDKTWVEPHIVSHWLPGQFNLGLSFEFGYNIKSKLSPWNIPLISILEISLAPHIGTDLRHEKPTLKAGAELKIYLADKLTLGFDFTHDTTEDKIQNNNTYIFNIGLNDITGTIYYISKIF